METTQKQVCDVMAGKGMTLAQSNVHLRRGTQKTRTKKLAGTLDVTREQLNFEIGRGGVVKEVDKKASILQRMKLNIESRGVVDPNEGREEPTRRTIINIILGGSSKRMRELAFGDQVVSYEQGSDNSHIVRQPAIERWAVDMYNFMVKKYGEQNIIAFIVHLDETNPHIHCTILPIIERKGKLVFSYTSYFGKSMREGRQKFSDLHNGLAEVNKKYGLVRGRSKTETGSRHKSYKKWLYEKLSAEGILQSDK